MKDVRRETSADLSHASTFIARHDNPADLEQISREGYHGFDETTLSASLTDVPFGNQYAAQHRNVASASDDSMSYQSVTPLSSTRESQDTPVENSSSFHSSVAPSTASAGSTVATRNPSTLTVRLQADPSNAFFATQSLSFDSLFIEDTEEDDIDVASNQVGNQDSGDESYDSEDYYAEEDGVNMTAYNSKTTDSGFIMVAGSPSSVDDDFDDVEMFTPKPYPPQNQHEGLGTFSRRPFKFVPSPTSNLSTAFTREDVSAEEKEEEKEKEEEEDEEEEDESPALTDLLGLSKASNEGEISSNVSRRSSDLNISEVLGFRRDGLWKNESSSSSEEQEQGGEDSQSDSGSRNLDGDEASYSEVDERSMDYDDIDGGDDEEFTGSRIEQEIAEMRSRLLAAVHNSLTSASALTTSMRNAPRGGSPSTSPSGSSPFFSAHKNAADSDLSNSYLQSQLSKSNPRENTQTESSDVNMFGVSQHSLLSGSMLSGGNLSSSYVTRGNHNSRLERSSFESGVLDSGGLDSGSLDNVSTKSSNLSTYSLDL